MNEKLYKGINKHKRINNELYKGINKHKRINNKLYNLMEAIEKDN